MKKTIQKSIVYLLTFLMLFASVQIGVSALYDAGADSKADYSEFYNSESVATATNDQLATMALDYVDAFLNLYGEEIAIKIQDELPALALQLSSLDEAVASIVSFLKSGKLTGDLGKLNTSALDGKSRQNGDLKFVYALVQFFSDNAGIISKLVTGEFDFGNVLTYFGAPEEEAKEIEDAVHNFDLYMMIKQGLDLDENTTIDEWLNDLINHEIQTIEIGAKTTYNETTNEEEREPGVPLDVEIDINNQTIYEIINALLEGVVEAFTKKLTGGQTFGPDNTLGDYIATLVQTTVEEFLGGDDSPLKGFTIAIREENIYTIIKNLVNALIENNKEMIDAALKEFSSLISGIPSKEYVLFYAVHGNGYTLVSPGTPVFQQVVSMANDANQNAGTFEYGGTSYFVIIDDQSSSIVATTAEIESRYDAVLAQLQTDEPENYQLAVDMMSLLDLVKDQVSLCIDDFGLIEYHDTYLGFIGELNHIIYVLINKFLNDPIVNAIGWEDGGLSLLSSNLWKFAQWLIGSEQYYAVLRMLAMMSSGGDKYNLTEPQQPSQIAIIAALLAENGEVDAALKQALRDGDSIADLVPPVINTLMQITDADTGRPLGEGWGYIPASNLQQIAAFFLNFAIKNENMINAGFNYDDVIFEGDGYADMDKDAWEETILTMLVDLAYYAATNALTELDADIFELLSVEDRKLLTFDEYKAMGWNHLEGLDYVLDWILYFVDGLLPATDNLGGDLYVLDNNGPWYKISKILNSLLPLGVIGGCAQTYGNGESFAFDIGVLLEDVIFGGLLNFDLGKILSLFTWNTHEGNFFNLPLLDAVVAVVQNFVNGLFPDTLTDDLVESFMTAITAENLIQLLRNFFASVSGRGAKLEVTAARLVRFVATVAIRLYEKETTENPDEEAEEIPQYAYALTSIENLEQAVVLLLNEFVVKGGLFAESEDEAQIIDNIIPPADGEPGMYPAPAREPAEETDEEGFPYSYDSLIYAADGTFLDEDEAYWKDMTLTILVDMVMLSLGEADFGFMSAEEVIENKDNGWGWADYLDDLVDWAFGYLHGFIPAIDNMSIERGVLDGQGASYKVSKVLNSLLPMSVINGCSKTYENNEVIPFDLSALFDRFYDLFTDLNVTGVTDMIAENTDEANPFAHNSLVKAVLIVLQNFINGILPGTIDEGMLISIDDTLHAAKLGKIAANLVRSVNGRKAYLIPSIMRIAQLNGGFDFLIPWLQCSTQHTFVKVPAYSEGGHRDVCSVCGFTFGYVATGAIMSQTDDDVTITYSEDAFDGEMTLEVEEIPTGDPNCRAWTIEPKVDGVKTQPNVPVQIKLPIPADWDVDTIVVMHIDDEDNIDYPEFDIETIDGVRYVVLWVSEFSDFSVTGSKVLKKAGDINGDGSVNNKDLNRLMKYLAGENVAFENWAIDVTGDGKVNNKDLNRLMKYLAGENVEMHIS